MQTFLPLPSFTQSAACLDRSRLGKQRVEVLQIHNALNGASGWQNHPAVLMWKGYDKALLNYGRVMCREWIGRGYNDAILPQFLERLREYEHPTTYEVPPWFDDDRFHASHRSNLLRKDPVFYGAFGWTEPNDLPYFWPTRHPEYTV